MAPFRGWAVILGAGQGVYSSCRSLQKGVWVSTFFLERVFIVPDLLKKLLQLGHPHTHDTLEFE